MRLKGLGGLVLGQEFALAPHRRTILGSSGLAGVVLAGDDVAREHARMEVSGDLSTVLLETAAPAVVARAREDSFFADRALNDTASSR